MTFFDSHDILIYRQRAKGNNRYALSATYTAFQADLQPNADGRLDNGVGRLTKGWTAFVDASVDVKEGDVIVSGGKRYGVKTVTNWSGAGLLDHKELDLESRDA